MSEEEAFLRLGKFFIFMRIDAWGKFMYILAAIVMFGILIATHELGHFIAAKSLGVKVNEYAIGMGPAIIKKQGKETLYSLRCLPIGGYCAMEGEDEDTGDKRAFISQAPWKKVIILIAGAATNFLFGVILIMLLYINTPYFVSNTVVETVDGFKYAENGIEPGDTILSIDGRRLLYADDFELYMQRAFDGKVDMVVLRDGVKIKLSDYPLQPEYYEVDGENVLRYGISFGVVKNTFPEEIKYSFNKSVSFVRMVYMGLSDLFSGRAGVKDMSGVVGIVTTVNDVAKQSETRTLAFKNIVYFSAFIAINLAVMNMLPIPALDGGRVFFLILTVIIEKITRRKINSKYEAYIHAAGMVLLLGLMAYVMFNDVIKLIH